MTPKSGSTWRPFTDTNRGVGMAMYRNGILGVGEIGMSLDYGVWVVVIFVGFSVAESSIVLQRNSLDTCCCKMWTTLK